MPIEARLLLSTNLCLDQETQLSENLKSLSSYVPNSLENISIEQWQTATNFDKAVVLRVLLLTRSVRPEPISETVGRWQSTLRTTSVLGPHVTRMICVPPLLDVFNPDPENHETTPELVLLKKLRRMTKANYDLLFCPDVDDPTEFINLMAIQILMSLRLPAASENSQSLFIEDRSRYEERM